MVKRIIDVRSNEISVLNRSKSYSLPQVVHLDYGKGYFSFLEEQV